MCGLVGMAGALTHDHRKMFKDMLVLDTIRGQHSTGVAAIKEDGKTGIFKRPLMPYDLFELKQYDRVVTHDVQCLIGHNRYATQGAINVTNAHPFEHGNIIGAHNGTLRGQHHLPDHKDFEVDSENLVHAINKIGMVDTLKVTHGAFALSVYDRESHTLQLVRNGERPLFYAFDKENKCMFWASEPFMIRIAARRNKVNVGKIHDIPTLSLHTFALPTEKKLPIPHPRVRQVEEYVPKYVAPYRPPAKGGANSNAGKSASDFRGTRNLAGNGTGSTQPAKKNRSLLGKEITVYPMHLRTLNTVPFVECMMVGHPYDTVRLYGSEEDRKKWLDWQGILKTKIDSVMASRYNTSSKTTEDGYLIGKGKNVEFLVEDEGQPETCPGPNDREVTKNEFDKLTKHGCSQCTCDLTFAKDEVVWDNDNPYCEFCWMNYGPGSPTVDTNFQGQIIPFKQQ